MMCVCVCVYVNTSMGADSSTCILGHINPAGKEAFELALRQRALPEQIRNVAFQELHWFGVSGAGLNR